MSKLHLTILFCCSFDVDIENTDQPSVSCDHLLHFYVIQVQISRSWIQLVGRDPAIHVWPSSSYSYGIRSKHMKVPVSPLDS